MGAVLTGYACPRCKEPDKDRANRPGANTVSQLDSAGSHAKKTAGPYPDAHPLCELAVVTPVQETFNLENSLASATRNDERLYVATATAKHRLHIRRLLCPLLGLPTQSQR